MATRRTQEERSTETRHALLEATLDCIMERGYTGASTTVISQLAGVSRGAQLHHYPTKLDLVLAATEHMFTTFANDVEALAEQARDPEFGMDGFLQGIWDRMFAGRFFFVSMELIVVARKDKVLHENLVPLIRNLHSRLDSTWCSFFTETTIAQARVDTLLNMTLCLMRGMAIQTVLREDPEYYREMLITWKTILESLIRQARDTGPGTDSATVATIPAGN